MITLRRPLLAVMVLIVAVVVLGWATRVSSDSPNPASLSGSWVGTVTAEIPEGLPPFTSLITFSPGGGVVESRRLYVPVSPLGPILETTGHGEWVKNGDGEFTVQFMFLIQGAPDNELNQGVPVATDHVRLDLELSDDRDELNGTFVSVVKDLSGNDIFIASGTYVATPIKVDPD